MKKQSAKQKEKTPALLFLDDHDALMLTPVAAEFLGLSPKYLRKLRTTGGGPEYVRLRTKRSGVRISQDAPIKPAGYRKTSGLKTRF